MTIIMVIAPNMGMPKMAPWELLSGAMGVSMVLGWVMHFVIGILYGLGYGFVFAPKVHIHNIWLKGIVFGMLALITAQIGMQVMGMIFQIPQIKGAMPLRLIAMLIGHIVFGIVTAKVIGKNKLIYAF
nr:hypothetical protein [uncultured Formosa sp.]